MPVAKTQDLGRLPPRDLLRHRSQNHFLYLHRPLHGGLRVRVHASHGLLLSPSVKRTFHVLTTLLLLPVALDGSSDQNAALRIGAYVSPRDARRKRSCVVTFR